MVWGGEKPPSRAFRSTRLGGKGQLLNFGKGHLWNETGCEVGGKKGVLDQKELKKEKREVKVVKERGGFIL